MTLPPVSCDKFLDIAIKAETEAGGITQAMRLLKNLRWFVQYPQIKCFALKAQTGTYTRGTLKLTRLDFNNQEDQINLALELNLIDGEFAEELHEKLLKNFEVDFMIGLDIWDDHLKITDSYPYDLVWNEIGETYLVERPKDVRERMAEIHKLFINSSLALQAAVNPLLRL